MKKITLLLSLALFLSCNTYKQTYSVSGSVVDYSIYTDKNFYITESNSVSFEYKPIGSALIECKSGYEIKKIIKAPEKAYDDGFAPMPDKVIYGDWKQGSIPDGLKMMYQFAIEMKANGVINLKTNYINSYIDPVSKEFYPSRLIITGMLIKK